MKSSRFKAVVCFLGALFLMEFAGALIAARAEDPWSVGAEAHRGKIGQRFTHLCPPTNAVSSGKRVWGTDIYTDDSGICQAAVHMGLIPRADNTSPGGTVMIEVRPGQSSYTGSTRNGVTSGSLGSWGGSFVFVAAPAPAPTQANRPPNAPTPLAPPNTWSPTVSPASITLQWRDNGDPDGDTLGFHVVVYVWNTTAKQWELSYENWPTSTSLTLPAWTPNAYCAWGVYAVDWRVRSTQWYAFSGWSFFYTSAR